MPSLDAAYCKLIRYDMTHNTDFTPDQSVKSVLFKPVTGSRELALLFSPWHAPDWYMARLAKKQNALGRSVLYTTLHDDILSADADRTAACWDVVADTYQAQINKIGVSPTHAQGISLGTSILMHTVTARDLPVRNLAFTPPGGDLAESLWTGRRTQPLRQQFEAQGVTLDDLFSRWHHLAPTNLAMHVQESLVSMKLSLGDSVVRPQTALEFAAALQAAGNTVDIQLANASLGHIGTTALAAA